MRRVVVLVIVASVLMLGVDSSTAEKIAAGADGDTLTAGAGLEFSTGGGGSVCSWRAATRGEVGSLGSNQPGYQPSDNPDDPVVFDNDDGVEMRLLVKTCPPPALPELVLVPDVGPPTLREEAQRQVEDRLPKPSESVEPMRAEGWVLVQTPLDFRTDELSWRPVEVTASAGGVWVTVRAVPVELTFDPGQPRVSTFWGPNEPSSVSCGGDASIAEFVLETPGECVFTYRNASSTADDGLAFEASLSIEWAVTYWSSDRTYSGTLSMDPTVSTFRCRWRRRKR